MYVVLSYMFRIFMCCMCVLYAKELRMEKSLMPVMEQIRICLLHIPFSDYSLKNVRQSLAECGLDRYTYTYQDELFINITSGDKKFQVDSITFKQYTGDLSQLTKLSTGDTVTFRQVYDSMQALKTQYQSTLPWYKRLFQMYDIAYDMDIDYHTDSCRINVFYTIKWFKIITVISIIFISCIGIVWKYDLHTKLWNAMF